MSYIIQNNQNVMSIKDTTSNPLAINANAQKYMYGFSTQIKGYITPLAAGNYAIMSSENKPVVVPGNTLFTAIGIKSVKAPFTGTQVAVATSATQAGPAENIILAAQSAATINEGIIRAPQTATINGAPKFLTAVVDGTNTAGSIEVSVFYCSL